MSHIVLDLPDPKPTLDAAIARQFADIQRQLMGLVKSQQEAAISMRTDFLSAMRQQQHDLTEAIESLVSAVERKPRDTGTSDALLGALRGLRQTLARLPDAMRSPAPTPTPPSPAQTKVTVNLNPLLARMDGLEAALVQGMQRSRSRTFGSNY